jgi:hypothetical protein
MDLETNKRPSPQMKCPRCHEKLTLRQAITLLNGSGFKQMALVKLPDGSITAIEAGIVNPNTVEILE